MIFGSAIHEALRNYFDAIVAEKSPTKEYLIKRFKESLTKFPIPTNEFAEMQTKGEEALSGYYETYHNTWKHNVVSEFNIKRIELDENITINGKIDKIEITKAQSYPK